jgi:FeS assembly SUF system protein
MDHTADHSEMTRDPIDVSKPPRARVSDAIDPDTGSETTAPRSRDYLEGFLAAKPADDAQGGAGSDLQADVIAALREIFDPEIPVNIYDLGLIYGVEVDENSDATVMMTLTTPHCPVAETMPGEVELRVSSVPGIRDAEVVLVWEPAWGPHKMSDEARLELGML